MSTAGDIMWTAFLLLTAVVFTILESAGWKSSNTLSRFIYTIGAKWPLSIFLWGLLAGGLAVHFWWHWSPAGSISTG